MQDSRADYISIIRFSTIMHWMPDDLSLAVLLLKRILCGMKEQRRSIKCQSSRQKMKTLSIIRKPRIRKLLFQMILRKQKQVSTLFRKESVIPRFFSFFFGLWSGLGFPIGQGLSLTRKQRNASHRFRQKNWNQSGRVPVIIARRKVKSRRKRQWSLRIIPILVREKSLSGSLVMRSFIRIQRVISVITERSGHIPISMRSELLRNSLICSLLMRKTR